MFKRRLLLFLLALALGSLPFKSTAGSASSYLAPCRSDGSIDVSACINQAFASAARSGMTEVDLVGTFATKQTIVVPNKMRLHGMSRGDPGQKGTTIIALPGFPTNQPIILLGPAPGPDFAVQVDNLTVECASYATIGIANLYAQEQSYVRNVLINDCGSVGLLIQGGGAQNSGPYTNLEIYPGGSNVTTDSRCIVVDNVLPMRGISGVTCNGGSYYTSRPDVGIQINGDGRYSDLHVEHAVTGVALGSPTMAAQSTIVENVEAGPDVDTGLVINNSPGINNQDIAVFALSCVGCKQLLIDAMTGNVLTTVSVGAYMMGNGADGGKTVISTNYGVGLKSYGSLTAQGANIGPGIGNSLGGTFNIQNALVGGATTASIIAGQGQGYQNLLEFRNVNNTVQSFFDPNGELHTPFVDFTRSDGSSDCNAGTPGRLRHLIVGNNSHIQSCLMVNGVYQWANLNP